MGREQGIDRLIQGAILALGGAAIALVAQSNISLQLMGCTVGCLSQPFWLYETFTKKQWGMFILSVWYTGAWIVGITLRIGA